MASSDPDNIFNEQLIGEIKRQQLPDNFLRTISQWYLPIAKHLAALAETSHTPLLVGINGGQGSGKSTLASFLTIILKSQYGINCANLSLDDFYLTRLERKSLADNIHPLLQTRGVPGTHDTRLLMQCLQQLKGLSAKESITIPRFDKAIDDRKKSSQWDTITGPIQIILLEGWCIGVTEQPESELQPAINNLEKEEDCDSIWRNYVNNQLRVEYAALWQQLDWLLLLKIPSFDSVLRWRTLQEQKLSLSYRNRHKTNSIRGGIDSPQTVSDNIMSKDEIYRFIQFYERITRHGLATLPEQADVVLTLNEDHQFSQLEFR